jgi:uncharacterized protein YndB with AHSA1/START domain
MTKNKQAVFTKDAANKKMVIVREFDASPKQVWEAWTTSSLLDMWWAPKPWKARTKTMDFREGGRWLYCMEGPDGSKTWVCVDYKTIDLHKNFTAVDFFCDENGNNNQDFPGMHWKNEFTETDTGTKVTVEITFSNGADFEKILQMGFEAGFTAALGNLDELLEK